MKPILVVGIVVAALFSFVPVTAQADPCSPASDTEWRIPDGVHLVCADRTIHVPSVVVEADAVLELRGVHLLVDPPRAASENPGEAQGILMQGGFFGGLGVGKGGQFFAYDSTLEAVNKHWPTLSSGGSNNMLRIVRSTVIGFYGINWVWDDGGIEDSTIIDVLHVWAENGHIRGSTFRGGLTDVDASAIFVNGGNDLLVIEDNLITDCHVGIELRGAQARPIIRGNTITDCAWGIVQTDVAADRAPPLTIHDNDVFNNRKRFCSACPGEVDAAFYGDGENNWWGSDPPDAAHIHHMDYSPWRTEPVNPERVPGGWPPPPPPTTSSTNPPPPSTSTTTTTTSTGPSSSPSPSPIQAPSPTPSPTPTTPTSPSSSSAPSPSSTSPASGPTQPSSSSPAVAPSSSTSPVPVSSSPPMGPPAPAPTATNPEPTAQPTPDTEEESTPEPMWPPAAAAAIDEEEPPVEPAVRYRWLEPAGPRPTVGHVPMPPAEGTTPGVGGLIGLVLMATIAVSRRYQ